MDGTDSSAARIPPGEDTLDPSTTPWRAFDAPAPRASSSAPEPASLPRALKLAGFATIVVFVSGAVLLAAGGSDERDVVVDAARPTDASAEPFGADLIVDVAGAVAEPGVYRLPAGSRVGDAITAAGGYGPRVDAQRVALELNLAAHLKDGEHLLVPSRDDVGASGTVGAGSAAGPDDTVAMDGLIDLNRATAAELDTLPGIGPVTAAKIISSREATPFSSAADLRDRKLVGQKTFDGLSGLVTVR